MDLDPETATADERDSYFSDDLSIGRLVLRGEEWGCPDDGMVVDLGWYATTEGGTYRLRVIHGNWQVPVVAFDDRQAHLTTAAVELCLVRLGADEDPQDVQRHLDELLSDRWLQNVSFAKCMHAGLT